MAELDEALGMWAGTTPLQRVEIARMRDQLGVYEMAVRLAVAEMLLAEHAAVDEKPRYPTQAELGQRVEQYIGRAAVLVEGAVPELDSPRGREDAELRDALQGGRVEGVEDRPLGVVSPDQGDRQ